MKGGAGRRRAKLWVFNILFFIFEINLGSLHATAPGCDVRAFFLGGGGHHGGPPPPLAAPGVHVVPPLYVCTLHACSALHLHAALLSCAPAAWLSVAILHSFVHITLHSCAHAALHSAAVGTWPCTALCTCSIALACNLAQLFARSLARHCTWHAALRSSVHVPLHSCAHPPFHRPGTLAHLHPIVHTHAWACTALHTQTPGVQPALQEEGKPSSAGDALQPFLPL